MSEELKAPTERTLSEALLVRFDSDAGDDLTVRGYFDALLSEVWADGEAFSGKRPFGNSSWEYDVYTPLVKAGFIAGTIDADGYAEVADIGQAHAFVHDLIHHALKDPT